MSLIKANGTGGVCVCGGAKGQRGFGAVGDPHPYTHTHTPNIFCVRKKYNLNVFCSVGGWHLAEDNDHLM